MGYGREEERVRVKVPVVQKRKAAVKYMQLPTEQEPSRMDIHTVERHIRKLTSVDTFYQGREHMDFNFVLNLWLDIPDVHRCIMKLKNGNFAIDELAITGFTPGQVKIIKQRYKEVKLSQTN